MVLLRLTHPKKYQKNKVTLIQFKRSKQPLFLAKDIPIYQNNRELTGNEQV